MCYLEVIHCLKKNFSEEIFNLKAVLEPSDEGGFSVYVPSLLGCISGGETKEEALHSIKETIELHIESVEDDLAISEKYSITELAVRQRFQALTMENSSRHSKEMGRLLYDKKIVTRLQKHIKKEVLKLTIPVHKPIKKSTLSHIIKQARISVDQLIILL